MTIRGLNDYLCPLWAFVPLTNDYGSNVSIVAQSNETGFFHMAASVMAMKDFNERNATMVPELDHDFMRDCPVQFDLLNSRFFDSGQYSHVASANFMEAFGDVIKEGTTSTIPGEDKFPCAIAGSYYDTPALDLGILAQSIEIPMVAHRVHAPRFLDVDASGNYCSQVYPSAAGQTEFVLEGIGRLGRTDYLTVLYPTTEMGTQIQEAFTIHFDQRNVEHWFTQYYVHPGRDAILKDTPATRGSLRDAMVKVKERGFRTIIAVMQHADSEIPVYAQLADELGMNNGDYFWVLFGIVENKVIYSDSVARLMDGSISIDPHEPNFFNVDNFVMRYYTMTEPDIPDLINAMNPLTPDQDGYKEASVELFYNSTYGFVMGQEFMYDAVMSIGIGACKAYEKKRQDDEDKPYVQILGLEHVQGIRSADFKGISGRVRFENEGKSPGARKSEDFIYGAWGTVPDNETGFWLNSNFVYFPANSSVFQHGPWFYAGATPFEAPQDLIDSHEPFWTETNPFIYFGGSTEPPLLRDPPDMNYLSSGLRYFGFVLLSFVWVAALVTIAFVYRHRQHKVLCAAQPHFLYLLCFGALVFSSSIIPLSFDEGYGWNAGQLTVACQSTPWLATMGYIITYGALFSKLFRVDKVLQFARRKVELYQVTWPVVIFLGLALLVLTVWTVAFPLQWERKELNEFTGESIGVCASDYMGVFSGLLAVLAVVPLLLTAGMAWTTKDVDDAYSESKWIFILILLQLELIILGAPVLTILRNLSTNGRYIGFVIIIWAFSISALVMIMLPKVIAYRAAVNGTENQQSQKRGQKSGVKVSGTSQEVMSSYAFGGEYSGGYNNYNSGRDNSVASHVDKFHVDSEVSRVLYESVSGAHPDGVKKPHVGNFSADNSIDCVRDESMSKPDQDPS